MKVINSIKIISIFLLLTFSSSIFAVDLVCSGTVTEISYHANNKFMIRLSSMNKAVFFCNPEEEWIVSGTTYKTGPESCKMMFSTFLAAKTSGAIIEAMYIDGDQKPSSCGAFESWKNINIRHFRLK